jgi:basic amino acid/polyamine antiporter, APA family
LACVVAAIVHLKTNLRLMEAITIIVGSMIGSGILVLPATMLLELPSPWWVLFAWLAGAVLTVFGALTFAEMSAMYPRAGGQYHFLKEGLGGPWSYLFGWAMFWVIMSGIVAAVAVTFSNFVGDFLNLGGRPTPLILGDWKTGLTLPAWGNAFVAVGCIGFLTILNSLGNKFGGWVQNLTTLGKYVGLLALVVAVFAFGDRNPDSFTPFTPTGSSGPITGFALISAFGAAMTLSLFAFDGWPQATYVASEIQRPKRNLPLALIVGPLITAVIYIALTLAYFWVIPMDQGLSIANDDEARIAVDAARAVWGSGGATFIGLVGLISVFGTVNAYVLTSPRVFYSMAKDGALLKGMAKLHPKRATPGYAMWIFFLWSSILAMTGVYRQTVLMAVFGIWAFYIPTAIAHLRLRRTQPDLERPFRAHPIVVLLFLASAVFVTVNYFIAESTRAIAIVCTIIIALGWPAYRLQQRGARRKAQPTVEAAPA